MKILSLDDQYKKHLSRYDLRYYPQYGKLLLEVSSFEFESDIEIHEIVKTLKEKNIHHLSINTYLNNYQLNMENLKYLSFLTGLGIGRGSYVNIEYLYHLKHLKYLFIYNDNYGEKIDFSKIPHLERLEIICSLKNIVGVNNLKNLKALKLQKYNEKDLSYLSNLNELEALELIQPKIETLNGIEKFRKLKCFTLFNANKLMSLENINHLRSLEYIAFSDCKKLSGYEKLNELKNLIYISLVKCGSITTLTWLENLKKLEFMGLVETNVLDGDISLLVKIPKHGYTNKRNFNYYQDKNNNDIKKF